MNLNTNWQQDVLYNLQMMYQEVKIVSVGSYVILGLGHIKIHLVSLNSCFSPQQFIDLQTNYAEKGNLLVHLWEDVWRARSLQVLSRISSFINKNKTVHGRQTKLINVEVNKAKLFFDEHHLQGSAKCKNYTGLEFKGDLVALAGFGPIRLMDKTKPDYQSIELVRFASRSGITVVGGLSKLLKYAVNQFNVDDLMSYSDRDWSTGKSFSKLGFENAGTTTPLKMLADKKEMKRLLISEKTKQTSVNFEDEKYDNRFVSVFNTGNLKFRYRIKK